MNSIDRILVPVDFSACSQAACEHAAFLAARFGAVIELLHVWDMPTFGGGVLPELGIGLGTTEDTSLADAVESRAMKAMESSVAAMERRGVSGVRRRLEMGDAASVIAKVAAEGRFSMIVMGTHGRRGFSRLLMGSVAEKVVRSAPCPVLTVRIPEEAAEAEPVRAEGARS